MSNLIVNISFGKWHLQISKDFPWLPRVTRNDYVRRPWNRLIVHAFFDYRA